MKKFKRFLLSLMLTLVIWAFFSWPLPKHLFSAIPISAQNVEKDHIRAMIPGDHLQLLYHFWLFSDMCRGHTPFFYNLYEFNAGNDRERLEVGPYYFPFSLVFTIGNAIGGRAFGWNITGFVSLWLSYYLTWLLTRRYTRHEFIAAGSALLVIVFPYRWASLLGGSPTGYAMLWAPALMLGLDIAVRDNRISGGLLAGLSILFSCWTDTHMFFFGVLMTPLWCLLVFLQKKEFVWSRRAHYLKLIRALLPVPIFVALALATSGVAKSIASESGTFAMGRSLNEVKLFSPVWQGLFSLSATGPSSHIYFGFGLVGILAFGWVAMLYTVREKWRPLLFFGLVSLVLAGILSLALGPYGPFKGKLFITARNLIPPYMMIRQPAKIFCLLPPCLALIAAFSYGFSEGSFGAAKFSERKWPAWTWWSLLLIIIGESRLRTDASLTKLDSEQSAYEVVASDASCSQIRAGALVIPLWPGDSHYASIYEHYTSLYRIRMINGYSPIVPPGYVDNIFWQFESANQGVLNDAQMNQLLNYKVRYILLHEDLFPEKVSPFPIGQTLQNLLNNPRLKLIGKANTVWAFKILAESSELDQPVNFMKYYFPARRWELERVTSTNAVVTVDEESASRYARSAPLTQSGVVASGAASMGGYATLSRPDACVEPKGTQVPVNMSLNWLFRARGQGAVAVITLSGAKTNHLDKVEINSPSWKWYSIPVVGSEAGYGWINARLCFDSGIVDLDYLCLASGAWNSPAIGETVEIPAVCFFHAGYTSEDLSGVIFRKEYDPVSVVFYGPMLPLKKGRYRIEMDFASEAKAGTDLGRFNIRRRGDEEENWTPVVAGKPACHTFEQKDNLPFFLAFLYERNADMQINKVSLTRLR